VILFSSFCMTNTKKIKALGSSTHIRWVAPGSADTLLSLCRSQIADFPRDFMSMALNCDSGLHVRQDKDTQHETSVFTPKRPLSAGIPSKDVHSSQSNHRISWISKPRTHLDKILFKTLTEIDVVIKICPRNLKLGLWVMH
jgi:hypothetical protein